MRFFIKNSVFMNTIGALPLYGLKLVIPDEASPLDCFLSTEAPGATASSRPPRHQPLRLHPCSPGVVCVYRALVLEC